MVTSFSPVNFIIFVLFVYVATHFYIYINYVRWEKGKLEEMLSSFAVNVLITVLFIPLLILVYTPIITIYCLSLPIQLSVLEELIVWSGKIPWIYVVFWILLVLALVQVEVARALAQIVIMYYLVIILKIMTPLVAVEGKIIVDFPLTRKMVL